MITESKTTTTAISASELAIVVSSDKRIDEYLAPRVDNPHDAEDIKQSTAERVLRSGVDKLAVESRLAIVFTELKREIVDFYSSRFRDAGRIEWTDDLEESIASSERYPCDDLERYEHHIQMLQRVNDALKKMKPTLSAPLLLAARNGMSYAELARLLDTTEHAVKKRIQRARAELRHHLFPEEKR